MSKLRSDFGKHWRLLISAALLSALSAAAVPNNWTNTTGDLWRASTNWSAAAAPTSASNVDPTQITNANSKTITIDSAAPVANLSLRGLTLSAPIGSTNTLALVNVPLGTPLTTSKAFLVGNRSALAITNSAVTANQDFDIVNASLILDSGSLTCALNCDLQNGGMLVNGGTLTATAGTTGLRMGRLNGAATSLTLNGGTVTALRLTLGSVTGTQNALALNGGNLILNDFLSLAQIQNTTGNVTMTGGSLFVTNGTTIIADRAAATFAQSGGNVFLADLKVGGLGLGTYNLSAGSITIMPRTTNDFCIVANQEDGTFNQSGGLTVVHSEIHVADFPNITGAINLTGGQCFATNDLVAIGRYGVGSMLISNATAVFTNTSVGRHDTGVGTLTIENSGNLFMIADLSIGRLTNSTGHVFVNGGLLSLTSDSLWVGRDGGGDLTVAGGGVRAKDVFVGMSEDHTNTPSGVATFTGGTTLIASNLTVGTSLVSTGQVVVAGGVIIATNPAGTASLSVNQGAFTVNSGTVTANRVWLTNTAGQFALNGGLLQANAMTVGNGAPFVVGNGVNPAALQLENGIYNFANGLVIASNATLTGCGTVIGAVTNFGTIIANCPGQVLLFPGDVNNLGAMYATNGGSLVIPPRITSLTKSGANATVNFSTMNGTNYVLEFNTNPASLAWSALPPAVLGNGGVKSKTDPTATNVMRGYRVRAQ